MPMSHHREPITALNAPAAIGPYSHAVRSGGLLFCSGQIPLDPESGELVGTSRPSRPAAAWRTCSASARRPGPRSGTRCHDGLDGPTSARSAEVNEVYGEFFESAPPARVAVGVAALPKGAQVEIDAIVALPD